ncbi:uncharacterized protein (TIGR03067 family) [Chryseobacterium sp. SLBN-27]|uniref:TIGR03067 domain-containing protein n=1 Tax=Chryseobacterium sp. SLBN-27 TaxID=3042287 RepID=UPI002855CA4C|nr:TIGR03067 domain-containing protein [Chryseobacterium sp. SLBN-27]MDR6159963.1 uncharacterized protein (TIGR03067 family) [Chryseobacterium sp. SLBN-27]
MKNIRCFLQLPIIVFCIGCTALNNKELKQLNGAWTPIKQEMSGKELPESYFRTQKLIIQDSTYSLTAESPDKGTLSYKNGKMDIYGKEGVNKNKHFTALYKLNGNQLTIIYNLKGDGYPIDFDTKLKPTLFLSVYKKD